MGKTPSKWFKTLLLGKKSPKPKLSKDKDILNPACVGERETLGSMNATPTGLTENPPPKLLPVVKANGSDEVHQDEMVADRVPTCETPSPIQNADEILLLQTHSLEDHEKVKLLHESATKAQAAYRGYLARRAFRTLKGIVRLQALVRGHLVRRQAIATLCCLRSIVKLQVIIRSRKDPLCATPMKFQVKLLKDVYIQKLLSFTLPTRPLRLQYAPGDPNSVLEWLERWTKSRFWDPPPVLKKKSKSQPKSKPKQLVAAAEIDQTRTKRSARKLPSSGEKVKRHVGKASGDPASQNGNEKSKANLKRTRDAKVVELDKKKSDQIAEKAPETPARDEPITTTMNITAQEDSVETVNPNKSLEPAGEELLHDLAGEVDELSLTELNKAAAATEKDLNLNSEDVNGNQQISNRRVSLPSSSIPRRPSYMAPTKSAKAKLRAQDSSSPLTDDAEKSAEKNGYTRRLSLPNGKVTSFSPRAIKIEKPVSSSRDASDKANKADWKR